jgi:RHS repeat-associated protein
MTVSRTGTTPTPFGFVGSGQYQTDNDSGLMLLGHRYYDASVGRFISSDPAKAGDNWYAYCDNNPLSGTDPEGLREGSDKNQARRRKIAQRAIDWIGRTDWGKDKKKDNFNPGDNKCNKFVYDVITSVGASPGLIHDDTWPPQAGDWGERKKGGIPKWRALGPGEMPKPGDVGAYKLKGGDAYTGHCGIIVVGSPGESDVSAHAGEVGPIDHQFPYDPDPKNKSQIVYHRYTGE